MAYRGCLNVSSCQETAMAPLIHARASRRARVTSASYFAERIRMMVPAPSSCSKVSITEDRNARCFFGDSVSMCAFSSTEIRVNSTDGGGISPATDGGRADRSGIGLTLTDRALTRDAAMSITDSLCVQPECAAFPRVNHLLKSERALPSAQCAPGPDGYAPPSVRTTPTHHGARR